MTEDERRDKDDDEDRAAARRYAMDFVKGYPRQSANELTSGARPAASIAEAAAPVEAEAGEVAALTGLL